MWYILTSKNLVKRNLIKRALITIIFCDVFSTGDGVWEHCSQAFLFSLVNPSGLVPTKLPIIPGKESRGIACDNRWGPVFGYEYDLHISQDANTNTNSSSSLASSYQCPPGQRSAFFTGAQNFTVTDYEVFGLHKCQQTDERGERRYINVATSFNT